MAIAYVTERAGTTGTWSGATTQTFSPTGTVAAGNLAVGAVGISLAAARVLSSVSDNTAGGLNVWQVDVQQQRGTSELVAIFSCVLVTQILSTDTITMTLNNTSGAKYELCLQEFSGVASASWKDVTQSATSGSNTTNRAAGTTAAAAAGDLGVAFWGLGVADASFTPDGSHTAFTVRSQVGGALQGEYALGVSGAQSPTGTGGASTTYAGAQSTYKVAPASTVSTRLGLTGVGL